MKSVLFSPHTEIERCIFPIKSKGINFYKLAPKWLRWRHSSQSGNGGGVRDEGWFMLPLPRVKIQAGLQSPGK